MSCTGDLAKAVRNRSDIHFGVYHAMLEWFHPFFVQDRANKYATRRFPEVFYVLQLVNTRV